MILLIAYFAWQKCESNGISQRRSCVVSVYHSISEELILLILLNSRTKIFINPKCVGFGPRYHYFEPHCKIAVVAQFADLLINFLAQSNN